MRKIPYVPDDGTRAALSSLPFAPEIVIPALQHITQNYPSVTDKFGLKSSFNPTFTNRKDRISGWISKNYYALEVEFYHINDR
jgi:hypothetical protein